MDKLCYKEFQFSAGRDNADEYAKSLANTLKQLGFDESLVKTETEYEYRGNHRYPDYVMVYIDSDDPILKTAIQIAK